METISQWIDALFPLIERSGWVIWPIIILSVLALAIFLERSWVLIVRSSRIVPGPFLRRVSGLLDEGRVEDVVVACRKDDSMMSRIFLAGVSMSGAGRELAREAMQDAGRRESRELDRYLGVLAAIAGVSPLLGLLGTVVGMIQIFQEIAGKQIGQYEALAGGIYVALYTTAAGLIVAIPSYLAYRALAGIAEGRAREMEDWAVDLLNRLMSAPGRMVKGGESAEGGSVLEGAGEGSP